MWWGLPGRLNLTSPKRLGIPFPHRVIMKILGVLFLLAFLPQTTPHLSLMPHETLELTRPELEWQPVMLEDGEIWYALNKADYTRWVQYRVGLEHEHVKCREGD